MKQERIEKLKDITEPDRIRLLLEREKVAAESASSRGLRQCRYSYPFLLPLWWSHITPEA